VAKRSELQRALNKINNTRGLSNAQKRAIKQDLRGLANNGGNLGAGDRKWLNATVNQAKAGNNPAPKPAPPIDNGSNPGFRPGGPIQPGPEPTENYTNAPMPTGSPGDGMQWSPVYVTDSEGRQWIQNWVPVPIPGYEKPGEKEEAGNSAKDREGAKKRLSDLLTQYGIIDDSENGQAFLKFLNGLVEEWGANNESTIMSYLREHDSYKERFKGNASRIKNGYGAMSEAEYITVESDIRKKMRAFGLDDAFYTNGRIATLIGGDVSSDEVGDRLTKAKKIVDSADSNIKSSLTSLYGASLGDLIGYVLDPALASEGLTRKINAGVAYGVAKGNGLELDATLSEQVGELTYGDERTARQTLGQAGELARSVRRLQTMEDDISLTDADVVEQQFGLDEEAGRKVKKLQSRERARFSGSGGAFEGTLNSGGGY
jgi:hypothetical protein